MSSSALLGQDSANPNVHPEKADDEKDLQARSTKKMKEGNHVFFADTSLPKDYSDLVEMQIAGAETGSYKDKVVGVRSGTVNEDGKVDEDGDSEEEIEEERMRVVKGQVGDYECPEFIFSKLEEKRIYRPWRRGVIVKLLGRRIGFKALETRLKQMWVRKGVISIIDLRNDYYLVAFSHEDDQYAMLMDGPWFIFYHYLTVQEWKPNFNPISDTIKEVAVWMQISGLPIEYYDSQILRFIGNSVGKTVKVDKNTLTQERGKYTRLCVQVNITKPLLAMFTLKGRQYTIKYEGLHMLCMTCGRFGHYKEGCPTKKNNDAGSNENKANEGKSKEPNDDGSGAEGPWRIVQKQRRNKKAIIGRNNTMAGLNIAPAKPANSGGSRFGVLNVDSMETNEECMDKELIGIEPIMEGTNDNDNVSTMHAVTAKKVKSRRGSGGESVKKGDNEIERNPKESKLATRVSHFKDKTALVTEGEVFEDATDQGTNLSSDSEMEFVVETPNSYRDFVATTVEGYAGGILVAWMKEYITIDVCIKNFQYIHLRVKYPNGEWWFFTPIYASPIETKRNNLWNDLKALASSIYEPWLVAGDFNDIASADEKGGGVTASRRKCNIFKERIDACNLIDMGAMGPKFTWRGPIFHGGQRIFERLDLALCNDQWRLKFPDGFVKVLTRLDYSDHHPILISSLHVPHSVAERQFRFESAWLLEDKYNNMLQQSWIKDGAIISNLHTVMTNIKVWKLQTMDQVIHAK
ncbi:hypothetical protein TSUD_129860 [Trifolium subterraneum]|uniref:CCHC-type domain-containing protein n=1 Tax=Trifolium subterraneum TaxID=3900 RepID=A0A2Z6PTZ7_TRISU|nr:hypothetical protein TSUD_129860 [Trifolium subterraneum]